MKKCDFNRHPRFYPATIELIQSECHWSRLFNYKRPGGVLRYTFVGVLSLCLYAMSSLAIAGTYTLLSPQGFQRQSGSPVTENITFTAIDPGGAYTLNIYNGGLEDHELTGEMVSSSTITLNGVGIIGPNEFNQNVNTLSKAISLQSGNDLTVTLKGKPGGVITLEIIGEDSVLPTITASLNPVPNGAGWHKTDVLVSFQCDDAASGIANCPAPVSVSTDGVSQLVSGTAVDNAGNQATTSVTVSLDKTSPFISVQPDSVANAAGWHRSATQVNFDCQDSLSGVTSCSPPVTVSVEGGGQIVSGNGTDVAGNTANASLVLNIDLTSPELNTQFSAQSNAAGWHNQIVELNFDCSDTLSGVLSCPIAQTLNSDGQGQAVNVTAQDKAGNVTNQSHSLSIDLTAPSIQIMSPAVGSILSERRPTVLLSVTDNFGLRLNSLLLIVNGVAFEGTCNVDNGAATCIPSSDLPLGDVVLEVSVLDQADNSASNQVSFRIETDQDGDGIDDNSDQCPNTPVGQSVDVVGCSPGQLDDDNDGVSNATDQCPATPFGETVDTIGCAASELDSDSDGVTDDLDQCPSTQPGITVDDIGCPIVVGDDTDGDTIPDSSDNCPAIYNPDQVDTDSDGIGDACEIIGGIAITSPLANQIINTSTISVSGSFTGPPGSGVNVNNRRACVYENQFVINNIPVNAGDHPIVAQLAPTLGIGESTQITISRNDDSLFTIALNTNCAVAPFNAKFRIEDLDPNIEYIEIDSNNDGIIDASLIDLSDPVFLHTYENPGTYQAKITGFDSNGIPHSQSFSLIVQDGAAINAVIQANWQNIIEGLSADNSAQALSKLTPSAQEIYGPVFEALQSNLPAILSTFSSLQPLDINTSYAEYAVNRTIDGVDRIFLIYFVKDENGDWKLDSM